MNTVNPAQVLCSEEGNWFVASGGLTEPLQGTEADCKRIAAALNQQAGVVEALEELLGEAEFWFDLYHKKGMTKTDYKLWLAMGQRPKAIRKARAALAAIKEKDRG